MSNKPVIFGCTAIVVVVVGSFVLLVTNLQYRTHRRLERMSDSVMRANRPKPLATGQNFPDPAPREIMTMASTLVDRGNAEQRAIGLIATQPGDETDRIIRDLQANRGNTPSDAWRLKIMEGDNWYHASQPEKAVQPYEQAMALMTDDTTARNDAALVHILTRAGNVAEHRRRAIEIAEGTLKLTPAGSAEWAIVQNELGLAWSDNPAGIPNENLTKAIAAFESSLTVDTKDGSPVQWAITQSKLGLAYSDDALTGDRDGHLRKGIAAYDAAMTVYTRYAFPTSWAWMENNLGIASMKLSTGDRAQNVTRAIAAYEGALTVYTQAYPVNWAGTQIALGVAWSNLPTGNRDENFHKAIAAYEKALTVDTKGAFPENWAWTKNALGFAWSHVTTGDQDENLNNALAAHKDALTVYAKGNHPQQKLETLVDISWCQLLMRDFAGTIATAKECAASPADLDLEVNSAHALLFLGRVDEATTIYKKHVGEKAGNRVWENIVREDFHEMETHGLTHPGFQRIREMLGLASP